MDKVNTLLTEDSTNNYLVTINNEKSSDLYKFLI